MNKLTEINTFRVGFAREFRVTVYARKLSGIFFHFHYEKGSGNPEFRINTGTTFLSVNRKFPEPCSVIPERSGKLLCKILVSEKIVL